MKKVELVCREILYGALETGKARFTQIGLAGALGISISTVNNALRPLRKMGAVRVKRRSFEVVNARKILYCWASIRNLEKDIIYRTRISSTVSEMEKKLPPDVVFAAYSAYKFRFKDVPADYSEVYVYCDEDNLKELVRRLPLRRGSPNLFVLRKDFLGNQMSVANVFVDLWNLREWYAGDFVKALEVRLNGILA